MNSNPLEEARRVIDDELAEIQNLRERLDQSFSAAVTLLKKCVEGHGKIIVCGVGKNGPIGLKFAATLNSTGAPAVTLHPQDALHGDLGLIAVNDVIVALSYSGETAEMLRLLPHLKAVGLPILAVTGKTNSTLARNSHTVLSVAVEREACPHNLAPTSSTTVTLVMLDAIAMALISARGFTRDDFARFHPGGTLGRFLLTRVSDIMRSTDRVALISPHDTVRSALTVMANVRSGAAVAIDEHGKLAGIFTHGDFVRAYQTGENPGDDLVSTYLTPNPVTINQDRLATEARAVFEKKPIDDIIVLDDNGKIVGMLDAQDLAGLPL